MAIAKACGLDVESENPALADIYWEQGSGRSIPKLIPDYVNDLNEIHEAEKSLQGEHDLTWYLQKLSQVRFRQGESGTIACMLDRLAFATARQRAEAFLRVKGLWREK